MMTTRPIRIDTSRAALRISGVILVAAVLGVSGCSSSIDSPVAPTVTSTAEGASAKGGPCHYTAGQLAIDPASQLQSDGVGTYVDGVSAVSAQFNSCTGDFIFDLTSGAGRHTTVDLTQPAPGNSNPSQGLSVNDDLHLTVGGVLNMTIGATTRTVVTMQWTPDRFAWTFYHGVNGAPEYLVTVTRTSSTSWHVETVVGQDDQAILREGTSKNSARLMGNYMNFLKMDLSFK